MGRRVGGAVAALFMGSIWLFAAAVAPAAGGDICGRPETARVAIVHGERVVAAFGVALADTPPLRRQGLMHCPSLAPGTGMLFTYPDRGRRVFWMKDTAIALAIVFIAADDRIAAIEYGRPMQLARIYSPDDITAVLEINAAESRSLAVGDRIRQLPPAP